VAAGEVRNEWRDVDRVHRAPVLGTDLDRAYCCHHPIPSVPRYVIVDTCFDATQERGLTVVAAADDQGDAARDAHTVDVAGIRRDQRYFERWR
jgi:hypothetical protein